MEVLYELLSVMEIRLAILMLTSFLVTYFTIPVIIRVAEMKHLFDEPDGRSSHSKRIPTLGGVSIFASITISISLYGNENFVDFDLLNASMIILFFFGIKDDILMISPIKKFSAQIFSALLITIGSEVRIPHLFGILEFNEIPFWFSIVLSVFIIILIINSFNLIDGVDGLSASIAIVTSSVFGAWFFINEYYSLSLLSIALVGSLLAFLRYNFSTKNKIFMGDTGSMIVGFIISILAIEFVKINGGVLINGNEGMKTAPVIAFSVLIVPLIDTLKVFMIRVLNKKSPFKPDRNHIHHRLLDLGFSHVKVTLILVVSNLIFIALAYHMHDTSIDKFILLIFSLAFFLNSLPYLVKTKSKKMMSFNSQSIDDNKVIKPVFRNKDKLENKTNAK